MTRYRPSMIILHFFKNNKIWKLRRKELLKEREKKGIEVDVLLYLLLNPQGIGPGHLLAWLAKGNVIARVACHKSSPWNKLAHCFLTQEICAHFETGTRMKISITRWSGNFPNELSTDINLSLWFLSVIRALHWKNKKNVTSYFNKKINKMN